MRADASATTAAGLQAVPLSAVCTRITRRVQATDLPIMMITSSDGFIRQDEKYSRYMAGESARRYTELRAGEFAYNKGNSKTYPQGCIYRMTEPAAAVPHVYFCFAIDETRLDTEYAAHVFRAGVLNDQLKTRINAGVRNNGLLNINADAFFSVAIPLPSLAEQRKIATILSAVDEVVEKTRAVVENLQTLKNAMMQELLIRGLPNRHTRFKQTEVGEIPEGWGVLTYGDLAADVPRAIQSGPFGSALKHSEFVSDGHLVIGIDNVQHGRFSIGSGNRISSSKFQELHRFEARPGDLLITVMATVGRCCVVPEDVEQAIITKHVYRLTVNRSRANPDFLMYCVYGVPAVANAVHGSTQGLSRPGLNKSLLLPLAFPIPPLAEQNRIVEILRSLDQRTSQEGNYRRFLTTTKSALMSVLLAGALRVTADEDVA